VPAPDFVGESGGFFRICAIFSRADFAIAWQQD